MTALTCAALLAAATPALPVVTPSPNPNGTTVGGHLAAITLTSNVAAATIDWTLSGPGFSIDGSGTSPVTTPADQALGDEGLYTLTATDAGGAQTALATFTVDRTPPPAPAVTSGPPPITGPQGPFTFGWTPDPTATSALWQLLDGIIVVANGATTAAQVSIPPPTLAAGDRILNFRVSLLDGVLNASPFGTWPPVVVDQTPPGAPTSLTGPAGATRSLTPSFSWQGTEVGGTFEWSVTDASGVDVLGAGGVRTTVGTSVTVPTLPLAPNVLHRLTFRVRQIDPFGNRGPEAAVPFTISTVRPPTPAPPTRWARYMKPSAGATGVSLRPLLSWRRILAGTTAYNIQVYRGRVKVLSVLRTTNRFRIPAGRLRPGTRYTWYVWMYVAKSRSYSRAPMASHFVTRR